MKQRAFVYFWIDKFVFIRLGKSILSSLKMAYIEKFVTGYGITFVANKGNSEAFVKAPEKWEEISSNLEINDRSILMFCGGKNNGKSSLVRYLINKYNQEHNSYIIYMDFDPGQPEMTTPGVVSAHIIRSTAQPLKSPTYLNVFQHEPIAMASVGGTNMSVNPQMYIENCRHIYNQVKEYQISQKEKRPIFVNTMGHIRNVGLAMLMDLIKICHPTNLTVINIESDPMRTIYADLSPRAMNTTSASFYYETSQQPKTKKLDYKLDIYNLGFLFVDSSSIATKNRTALQLAYLGSIPEALYKPVMQLSPRWLSLDTVSIYCVSSYPLKPAIVLELLHHSWVHLVKNKRSNSDQKSGDNTLCTVLDNVSENTMFGCGIIAHIDIEKRRLAIVTPLSQEIINEEVDCVIKPLSIQVAREIIQSSEP